MTDCGCVVEFDGSQYPVPAIEIEYCQLHAAALETARQRDLLQVAAQVVVPWLKEWRVTGTLIADLEAALEQAQATEVPS